MRHRDLTISRQQTADSVHAIVYAVEPTGDITYVHMRSGGDPIVASVPPDVTYTPDEDIWVTPDLNRVHLFDAHTGLAIRDATAAPGQLPLADSRPKRWPSKTTRWN